MEERYSWVKTRYFLKDGEVCTLKSIAAVGLLWCTPVIPALGKLRQEDYHESEASINYFRHYSDYFNKNCVYVNE